VVLSREGRGRGITLSGIGERRGNFPGGKKMEDVSATTKLERGRDGHRLLDALIKKLKELYWR